MQNLRNDGISRRTFAAMAGGAAAGLTTAFLFPVRAIAQQNTLKILQWSHFVPGYDKWFDEVFTRDWGAKHDTNVIVDHVAIGEIEARAAAEVSAQRGHDLFMFLSPPSAYQSQVIDHREIYEEVQAKFACPVDLALKSTYNPTTDKFFAFSDSYVPDPGNYRVDLWSHVGLARGPDTWDDLRLGGKRIREKFGNPVGIGLSRELDTNMALRSLLWSFGGSEQDAEGKPTLKSKDTVEAVKFMRALYRETETPEVFSWDPSSNNRGILSGRLSYVTNGISVTRTAERTNSEMSGQIQLRPALKGPVSRLAANHLINCYVIWNFASNKDGATQFLVDLVRNFETVFKTSEFYNFPSFPPTVPNIRSLLADDPKAKPRNKYVALADALSWSTNVGHPGYATAAINEVFSTFLIPRMFARAARDEVTPEAAVDAADHEIRRIFDKWQGPTAPPVTGTHPPRPKPKSPCAPRGGQRIG